MSCAVGHVSCGVKPECTNERRPDLADEVLEVDFTVPHTIPTHEEPVSFIHHLDWPTLRRLAETSNKSCRDFTSTTRHKAVDRAHDREAATAADGDVS